MNETLQRPEITTTEAEGHAARPSLPRRAALRVLGAVAAVLAVLYVSVGTASAGAPAATIPTEISDGVADIQENILLYPALMVGAAVLIGVGFLMVRVAPKVIRWVSARFG